MDFSYILYIWCIFIVLLRINIIYMSKLDKDIFYYLLMKSDNSLLQKYRDYFPSCNRIPVACDSYIFMIVYILYIPIVSSIVIWKHLKNIYSDLLLYIKHPLLLSKGMAYNAVLPYITMNSKLTHTTFNKIYWGKLFRKLEIPTPIIIGTIKNGVVKYKKGQSVDVTTKHIIKEVHGCCGNGIEMFDKNNIPPTGYYIIQEYIDIGNSATTYRIITNTFDNIVSVMEVYSLKNDSLVSNISHGGKLTLIDNINNNVLKNVLKNAIKQSIKAHERVNRSNECITIGWDVIIKDGVSYFLEGNIGVPVNSDKYIKCVNYFYKNYV